MITIYPQDKHNTLGVTKGIILLPIGLFGLQSNVHKLIKLVEYLIGSLLIFLPHIVGDGELTITWSVPSLNRG